MLVVHLAVDAEQAFLAAVDLCVDAGCRQRSADRFQDLADHFTPVAARRLDCFGQGAVAQRVQVRERQFLQLAVDIVQSQAMRDRDVDLHRLAGDAALLFRDHHAQRAHIVQTVGQLDQDHAHIARHGQQHLAEIFGLGFDLALEFDLVQFR